MNFLEIKEHFSLPSTLDVSETSRLICATVLSKVEMLSYDNNTFQNEN